MSRTASSDTETLRSKIEDHPAMSWETISPEDSRHRGRVWRHWQALLDGGKLRQIDLVHLAELLDATYMRGHEAGWEGAES